MSATDIEKLSADERLGLIEQLWESLSSHPEEVPLTLAQRHELNARLDHLDSEGPEGIPWAEVLRHIRSRLQ